MNTIRAPGGPMIIDLTRFDLHEAGTVILPFAERLGRVSAAGEPSGESEDAEFPLSVEGTIEVTRAGEVVWVRGDLVVPARLTCGRCLQPFWEQLPVRFTEGFEFQEPSARRDEAPFTIEPSPRRRGLDEEDFLVRLAEPQLDLGTVVLEHALIALPMVPACRDDCLGLCPACGADRNTGPCACGQPTGMSDERI